MKNNRKNTSMSIAAEDFTALCRSIDGVRKPKGLIRTLLLIVTLTAPLALFSQTASFTGVQSTVPFGAPIAPVAVAVDGAGDVFIADQVSSSVLELPWTGSGYGPQTTVPASIKTLGNLAVDRTGDVFIFDNGINGVLEVPWTGSGYGPQVTLLTSGVASQSIALDAAGDIFIGDYPNHRVVELPWTGSGYGAQTTVPASGISEPWGVALDGKGDLFIADRASNSIVEMPWTESGFGAQITVASGFTNPRGFAADAAGNLFVSNANSNNLVEVPWTGTSYGPQTVLPASGLNFPLGLAVDTRGNVFIADAENQNVVEMQLSSVNFGSTDICPAGQSTPAPCNQTLTLNYTINAATTIGSVNVVAQGASNLDFILGNTTCSGAQPVGSSCTVTATFAPTAPGSRSGAVQLVDASGNVQATTLLYGQGQGPAIAYGPGPQVSVGSGRLFPSGISVDEAGNTYIADNLNGFVLKLTPGGAQTRVPASGLTGPVGVAVDGAGDVFVSDFPNNRVIEVSPTGVQSTVPATGLDEPQGIAVDGAGDLFIADAANNRVVEVPANGAPQLTLGSGLNDPVAVAVDASGNLFIADSYNSRVVELTPAGVQTTILDGGYGLSRPSGVAVDAAGDLFIAYLGIRGYVEVSPSGIPSLILLHNVNGTWQPDAIAVDAIGDIFVGDTFFGNNGLAELQRSQLPAFTFAATNLGQTTGPQSVTIENVGNQPLNGLGLSIGANFEQVAGSGAPEDCSSSFSLASGAGCNLSISFAPTAAGPINGAAVLMDNALNGNPATQSITLSGTGQMAAPTLAFASIPSQTYGAAPFTVIASSNSTGAVTYSVVNGPATISGNTVMLAGAGVVTLEASQAAAGDYTSATATTSFSVSQAVLTATAASASRAYGATNPTFTYNVTGFVNGDTSSVVSGAATLTTTATDTSTPGSYAISFSSQGLTASNYSFNYVNGALTVTQASQTITFNPVSNQLQGASLTLSATSSSGLAVSFTSLTAGVCTVSGTTATMVNAGTCTVQASQTGNANYAAATLVSESFTALPSFTIIPTPANEKVQRGVLAAFVLQLNAGSGFNGNVALSCSGGPAGAECADLPMTVKLKSNGVAYAISGILFPAKTTPGTYTMTFTGVSGSITESATATFTVTK